MAGGTYGVGQRVGHQHAGDGAADEYHLFTQIADGKTISPTGKRFAIGMATIGHWSGNTMDHEWLFWDNQDFMKQLGLGN